ncbi:hypothetical protein PybrP1_005923, partial [[Pythium] brassicae (nom. inval.)]
RVGEAAEELHRLFQSDDLRDAKLLVYANKQDLPGSMSLAEIKAELKLDGGIYEGLDWLSSALLGGEWVVVDDDDGSRDNPAPASMWSCLSAIAGALRSASTLLYKLQRDKVVETELTVGFNIETLWHYNMEIMAVDFGGTAYLRPTWRDLPNCMTFSELETALRSREVARDPFRIQLASVTRGDGIRDGLDRLYRAISRQIK